MDPNQRLEYLKQVNLEVKFNGINCLESFVSNLSVSACFCLVQIDHLTCIMLTYCQIRVAPHPGKKIDHNGIRVQLIGQIELASERGTFYDFLSLGMSTDQMAFAPFQHLLNTVYLMATPMAFVLH